MANISYRMGSKLQFDRSKEKFINDAQALCRLRNSLKNGE